MSLTSVRAGRALCGLGLATLGVDCATLGLHDPGNAEGPEVVDVVMSDSHIEVRPFRR
jgi:hypothetical protein